MARKTIKSKANQSKQPVTDLSYWASDLAFVPEDWKESRTWAAQKLFNLKLNCAPLVATDRVVNYRKLGRLDLDRQTYVNMVDPPTPSGLGGKADYFAADFKANPINIHLDNIVRAKMDKIGVVNKLQVNEIDKFAKSQRQLDKDKVIHQRVFRDIISYAIKELGGVLPPLSRSETAEEYITKLEGKNPSRGTDEVSRIIDQIKLKVKDDKTYALYERYAYKGEVERSFEMWMEHDLINQNKWRNVSQFFNDDLKNFNAAVGRCYTDETSGRQIVEYIEPNSFFTNPFTQEDGGDITDCFHEKNITFADFVKQFGTTLTNEQLKEVFLLNKVSSASGFGHNVDWTDQPTTQRNNARIRIGFASVLTQETKFSNEYVKNRTPEYTPNVDTWTPDKESAEQKQKIYNVWYSFYYVPPPTTTLNGTNSQASWNWQSRYIFNIKKNIDMYRYGIDYRYAKPDYVVWRDLRPSFTDIAQAYMPKIHNMWHKFQNSIIQDTTALAIDVDLITGLLNAVDEANNKDPENLAKGSTGGNGVDAGMEAWRSLKQGGMGFVKFRDKNGELLVPDPSKLFVPINTGHLEKAEKYLEMMLQLYEQLKIALAQSDVSEGQQGKPRTVTAAIEASLEASNNAMFFLEKPARELLIMFGERSVQWQLNMIKEKKKYGYEQRWNNYVEVVGLAQALMVEGLEDMNAEDIGLTISLEDTTQMREWIFQLANEMVKNKELSIDALALVVEVSKTNYKFAMALLLLSAEEKSEENAQIADMQFQQQMKLKQMDLQTAQALVGAKSQGQQQAIDLQGQIDAKLAELSNQLKFQSQSQLKQQTTESRIKEHDAKADKDANVKQQESLLVTQ